MTWKIELDHTVEKELKKLDKLIALRILKFLRDKLAKTILFLFFLIMNLELIYGYDF